LPPLERKDPDSRLNVAHREGRIVADAAFLYLPSLGSAVLDF
jgi:hypothetical protein